MGFPYPSADREPWEVKAHQAPVRAEEDLRLAPSEAALASASDEPSEQALQGIAAG